MVQNLHHLQEPLSMIHISADAIDARPPADAQTRTVDARLTFTPVSAQCPFFNASKHNVFHKRQVAIPSAPEITAVESTIDNRLLEKMDVGPSRLAEDDAQLFTAPEPLQGAPSSIDYDEAYAFPDSSEDECEAPAGSEPISIRIPNGLLVSPRSYYEPFESPRPLMSERDALRMLLPQRSAAEDDFLELRLDDFAVYCDTEHCPNEMRPLNQLGTEPTLPDLCFDGILANGEGQSAYVRCVSIHALPLGNYGRESTDSSSTRDNMWLQSEQSAANGIYYKLGTPAVEYKRFFEPFLWVAGLAKYFVDFLDAKHAEQQQVTIHHFQRDFVAWLVAAYTASDRVEELGTWMSKHPRLDYRAAVNANISFLYKEAVGVLGSRMTDFHSLWKEVLFCQKYIPYPPHTNDNRIVVTQYIYDCFHHLPFKDLMEVVGFSAITKRQRLDLIGQRQSPTFCLPSDRPKPAELHSIGPGDTISTARDAAESGTLWEKEAARDDQYDDLWFALVQGVSVDSDGHRVFEVIWYYRPGDTLCGLMKYLWPNELFLSDHCSCGEASKIREDEVRRVHEVEFGGGPETSKEFFCRQVYLIEDKVWVSLTQSHLRCCHTNDTPVPDGAEYCV
ncbi:DNA methyltransferase Dim-2 [Cordyceps javanica]|uniref:DNA methyltransferase Dim-2 n=1 Tax=Cordyceps javanica TaxID=43265 RepID=A0A545URW4_9HYPO|nr:DNA methyltransferase Dim-2 [Cordyceps javanica]TQW04012.1 DNA methyltransferase Dim-2 [Cordyceps javanica]